MKILHLLNNWKWTEISEPAVEMALAQQELGADVTLVCGKPKINIATTVHSAAQDKGLKKIILLNMPKHLRPLTLLQDFRQLYPRCRELKPDVLHCHMTNSHLMGAMLRKTAKIVVRSFYHPEKPPLDLRSRILFRHFTDALTVINDQAKYSFSYKYKLDAARIALIKPGIDLHRFSPARNLTSVGEPFGLKDRYLVIGVVSRIRRSRRLDIPLEALSRLIADYPRLRLLLVGRGRANAVREVVQGPARKMGIEEKIIPAGYCQGDRLVAAYREMHVLVYPTPGTDKTCRTVREAMAAGVPVIAPYTGYLPELIRPGENGDFMDLTPESLCQVLHRLLQDKRQLDKLSRGALATAQNEFSWPDKAKKIMQFYQHLTANHSSAVK